MVARTRRFGGKFWWDDWFIVASFCVLTAVSVGAEISESNSPLHVEKAKTES